MENGKPKTALVLSGGGARGLAHLGALKVFEKAGIKFDMIIGCSFGAIIGGMYAQTPSIDKVEARLFQFMESTAYEGLGINHLRKGGSSSGYLQLFSKKIKKLVALGFATRRQSLLKSERLINCVHSLIRPGNIEDTPIRFACNATDLNSGSPYLFIDGDMRQAIIASATIPGYFPPVMHDGRTLVDGAVAYDLPAKFAHELGAEHVIAIDVHPAIQPGDEFNNILDIIVRTRAITGNVLSREIQHHVDILINPKVKQYRWFDFNRYEDIVAAGEAAATEHLEAIGTLLRPPKPAPRRRMALIDRLTSWASRSN